MRTSLTLGFALVVAAVACSATGPAGERTARTSAAETVGGCTCVTSGTCADETFSNIPSNGTYYITTFGGGSDTQPMACGGTADGTWAYVADEARFGCGTLLQISANGKSCVAQVSDCGPNRCVEQAAANDACGTNFPIIDASPFITQYLFNESSAGWSDDTPITATVVDSSSTVGCPGMAVGGSGSSSGGTGSSSGSAGSSSGSAGSSSGSAGSSSGSTGSSSGGTGSSSGSTGSSSGSAGSSSGSAGFADDHQSGDGYSVGISGTDHGWGVSGAGLVLAALASRRRRVTTTRA
jgi:hypothetical protein